MDGISSGLAIYTDTDLDVPEETKVTSHYQKALNLPPHSEIHVVLQYILLSDMYRMTLAIADNCIQHQDLTKAVQAAADELKEIIHYGSNFDFTEKLLGATKNTISLVNRDGQRLTGKDMKNYIVTVREKLRPKARTLMYKSKTSFFNHTWMTLRWLEAKLELQRLALAEAEKENDSYETREKRKTSARKGPKFGSKFGLGLNPDPDQMATD
ncbi:hypothetical protein Dda_3462 [Drechslerella dactyloides]|uniref:Uncharacterized protein n=1 Tax=Drechslerella dactyloides TaxID=74499 RepID=A0AAD6J3P2_DREDA|nr:hypothetical protein Dda_3462 [Drechslerella dactyloides]